jgi:(3R)-3-hydroxyacyl-CoA dehydrogenase / 3a,7a,12a-trihydroxy-5b-cholest-24-enoyl-CoA hydratase / enoyl-CoA hydratase 2
MPIDLKVVGRELPTLEYSYTQRDVMLYALGVGAGESPEDLKFVYENGLEVLPTFGVVPPFPALMGIVGMEGFDVSLASLLHGEQYMEVRRHPVPTEGVLTSKPRISAVYDKGKGALVEMEVDTVDDKGNVVYFNRFGSFFRGEGGFGGEKGPEPGHEPPDRAPDKVASMQTLPRQALIYRLSGDYNPLHSDPAFAAMAGFEKPILHGLCSFGFAARAVLKCWCGNDPNKFKAIKVRFSRPVFPGETIVTEMWQDGEDKIIFQAKTAERGQYCITNAAVWLT